MRKGKSFAAPPRQRWAANDPEDYGIRRPRQYEHLMLVRSQAINQRPPDGAPVSALYATTSATRIAASLRVSVMRRFDCGNTSTVAQPQAFRNDRSTVSGGSEL
jgi:hypothetical protein